MMMLELALLPVGLAAAVFAFKRLSRRIEKRRILNNLLAVASEDFHNAASRMLRTPDELPDCVLDRLSLMSRSGFERGSEIAFLNAIKSAQDAPTAPTAPDHRSDFVSEVDKMRPELKEFFIQATSSWFNIMTHKRGRYHDKIALEVMKGEAKRIEPSKQAIAVASKMQALAC